LTQPAARTCTACAHSDRDVSRTRCPSSGTPARHAPRAIIESPVPASPRRPRPMTLPAEPQTAATYKQYIDGEWVEAESGDTYDVLNPSNQEVIAKVPRGGQADAARAVMAARRAFDAGEWRTKSD